MELNKLIRLSSSVLKQTKPFDVDDVLYDLRVNGVHEITNEEVKSYLQRLQKEGLISFDATRYRVSFYPIHT